MFEGVLIRTLFINSLVARHPYGFHLKFLAGQLNHWELEEPARVSLPSKGPIRRMLGPRFSVQMPMNPSYGRHHPHPTIWGHRCFLWVPRNQWLILQGCSPKTSPRTWAPSQVQKVSPAWCCWALWDTPVICIKRRLKFRCCVAVRRC